MASFNKVRVKKLYLPSQTAGGNGGQRSVLVTASAEDLNALVGAATSGTNGLLLAGTYTNAISILGTATTGINISGANTTGVSVAGATTNALSLSGATTTSALNITATDTAGTYGIYLKKTVTGMAGSSYVGAYIRAEAATTAATAKSLYGAIIYGTSNAVTHTTGSLWGSLHYAYAKGDAAQTIANIYGIQSEISQDAGRSNALTISTEAAFFLGKLTGGNITGLTKVHGMILRFGDMDGDSNAYGNGILIEDDAGMSGTSTLTTGINISIATATAINIAGTTTTAVNVASGAVNIGVTGTRRTLVAATPLFNMWATSAATTGNLRTAQFNTYYTGTTATENIEAVASIVTSNVGAGQWVNAFYGKVDLATNGSVSGQGGVICAEIAMPSASPAGGRYACFEAEINAAGTGFGVSTSFFNGNAWGAQVAAFRTSGFIFDFTGLGTATGGKIFDTCTAAAASHALRINIDGTPYYIMLNSNVDA